MILAHKNGTIQIVSLIKTNENSTTVIAVHGTSKPTRVMKLEKSRKLFDGRLATYQAIDWINGAVR